MIDLASIYRPKTVPFAHQRVALERGAFKWVFGFLSDPGTGKSKMIIDNAALLYEHGTISAVLIFAPNDVHDQWVDEQIPLHLPDRITTRCAVWHSNSAKARRTCQTLITHHLPDRLTVLAMNHESLGTGAGVKIAKAFCRAYSTMLVFDESHYLKTPKASRTKAATHQLRPLAKVVRIATGTVADTPFDLFAQMRLMDERILGFDSFLTFKHHYGQFTTEYVQRFDRRQQKRVLQKYESLASYQRIEELRQRIAPYVHICHKEECTDLPPKIYAERRSHLSAAQQELYSEIKASGIALLEQAEAGQPVKVAHLADFDDEDQLLAQIIDPAARLTTSIKLVLSLRLQQIAGGFATTDDGKVSAIDGGQAFPRLTDTTDMIKHIRGKVIVWAEFRPELELLRRHLAECGEQVELIYGATSRTDRTEILSHFKNPADPLRVLVAHRRTLGTGQNLQVAQDEIFYSNGPSSIARTQCEDRTHRIGQTGTVNIWDLVAAPCDRTRLESLRAKKNLTDTLLHKTARQLQEMW